MPKEIMYDEKWSIYHEMGLIFLIVPLTIFMTIRSFTKKQHWTYVLAALSPLIVGPTFGVFHQNKEEKELQMYGVKGKAFVTSLKFHNSNKGLDYWKVKCEFEVKDVKYHVIFNERISHDKTTPPYKIGDTVGLLYSSNFPPINEVETKEDIEYKKQIKQ